jgi:hypothetical protein
LDFHIIEVSLFYATELVGRGGLEPPCDVPILQTGVVAAGPPTRVFLYFGLLGTHFLHKPDLERAVIDVPHTLQNISFLLL